MTGGIETREDGTQISVDIPIWSGCNNNPGNWKEEELSKLELPKELPRTGQDINYFGWGMLFIGILLIIKGLRMARKNVQR